MIIQIANILDAQEIEEARQILHCASFEDGRKTAGWSARLVKNNEQAAASEAADDLRAHITQQLLKNELFVLAARPKALTRLLLSRYVSGHAYGTHVDNVFMENMRIDVSFTLFLSDPDSYEGGELIIESAAGEQGFKLPQGSAIVYPASTLHRVSEVVRGERLAAVGWARSFVRDPQKREILFDLETARRSLFAQEGKTANFDLLSKSSANLLRLWAED